MCDTEFQQKNKTKKVHAPHTEVTRAHRKLAKEQPAKARVVVTLIFDAAKFNPASAHVRAASRREHFYAFKTSWNGAKIGQLESLALLSCGYYFEGFSVKISNLFLVLPAHHTKI